MKQEKIDVGVLYVEDDPSAMALMRRILEQYIDPLYCASDGAEGLEVFMQHRPRIVITDLRMPKMTGLELVEEIRAVAPETRVVITSAYSDSEYTIKAIELGVDKFCLKPVDVENLAGQLQKMAYALKLEAEYDETKRLLTEYKKAIDASTIVSITDGSGVITYVNDEFCRVMGYSREELVGQNHNVVRHPSVPRSFFHDMWEHLKQHDIWRGRLHNKAKDGHSVYIDTTIVPITGPEGEVLEYISFKKDITEQVRQERELEQIRLEQTELTVDRALNIGLSSLIPAMPVMAFVVDADGRVLEASAPLLDFFEDDGSQRFAERIAVGEINLCHLLKGDVSGGCGIGGLEELQLMVDDFAPLLVEVGGAAGHPKMFEIRYQVVELEGSRRYVIYLLNGTAEG